MSALCNHSARRPKMLMKTPMPNATMPCIRTVPQTPRYARNTKEKYATLMLTAPPQPLYRPLTSPATLPVPVSQQVHLHSSPNP